MILEMYSIYDHAAKAYNQPFFVNTLGVAVRTFESTVNNNGEANTINANPEQFTLFKIGTYDDSNGSISPLDTPEPVCKALDVMEPTLNRDQVMETLQELLDKVTKLENLQ